MTQFTIKVFVKTVILSILLVAFGYSANAQNPNQKIKVYFNHMPNTSVSLGSTPYYTQYFADTLAKLIDSAKYSVDLAQYDYTASSGDLVAPIATACNAAAARGVIVRWIYCGTSPNSGLSLLSSRVHTESSPTTGMQSGYIMHNKFVVIDCNSLTPSQAIISTSSFDWSDEMSTSDYNNMVVIQDQTLAQAYNSQFNQMWGGTDSIPGASPKFSTNKTASAVNSFTVNGTPIQVYFSPMDGASSQLQNAANSADYELYFGIYDFTINNVATAMQNKYTSGVTGFGIEDQYGQSSSPYATLSASGVLGTSRFKIYSGSYIYHNKVICVDANHPANDPLVGCGSYNWTSTASNVSDENFMVIHNATVANEYYQSLCADFASLGGAACTSYLGIEKYDFGSDQVAVYPNPFIDAVSINVKNAGETLSVRITDQLGKVIFENKATQTNEMKLNLGELSEGVYFVTVTTGNNQYTQKLIK